jgi:hypothetical protein
MICLSLSDSDEFVVESKVHGCRRVKEEEVGVMRRPVPFDKSLPLKI